MRTVSIAAVVVALLRGACAWAGAAESQSVSASDAASETGSLETVVVTGSRIPRTAVEGPSPVVVITAEDIKSNGFATVSELMSSVTQNLGALDNNQYADGFSPGAQAVDLRGLGSNHTLVLVNGRRIADYPQSYGGNSNFTDISAIPASLVERVEILSGSASAIYGSDAVSGVINFIMKQKADGTTVDFRDGATQHGGGASQRLQITSGWSNDRLDTVFGAEFYYSRPLWAYQRSFTNSRLDSPADPSDIVASQVFVRMDEDENYLDPGQATCDRLSYLDRHSVGYRYRDGWGNYCGSYRDVGYGTLENGRKQLSIYGSATYHVNDSMSLFLDLQGAYSHQISYNTPLQWENSYKLNGDSTPIPFFNAATGQIEQWQRRYFTIEENGGFDAGEIHNIDKAFTINTGVKGTFGQSTWNYEGALMHSQNRLESRWPALVSAKAQALYLGPSLGVDPDSGYQIYDAPISRLYTPLTVDEFRSITNVSVDNDSSRSDIVSFTVNNGHLVELPAGPVGFAGVAEWGTQHYELDVDPLSLDGSYFGLHNTGALGSRNHYGLGSEFRIPVFSMLNATAAGRYDSYTYSGTTSGKFTYNAGLEFRPIESLLLRGSYGTGFRAPDLSFLYAGLSGSSSDGTDYYLCRRDEPGSGPDYFDNCSNGDVGFNGRSIGSTKLKDETSTSLTYGIVFAPLKGLQVSVDYYRITLKNEVEYQESDQILREEADCRLGHTEGGAPVDPNSALCQQVITQVVRNSPTAGFNPSGITSVLVLPINAAMDKTSGVDLEAHYQFEAGKLGRFAFQAGFTDVLTHDLQLFPGDPIDNELTDWFTYVIPRTKATYSGSWGIGPLTTTVHGQRIGGIPNYDGTQRLGATSIYNASINYRLAPRANLTFIVDNLFDTKPYRDSTWTSYPYYSRNWFSPVGRAFFAEVSVKFGGTEPASLRTAAAALLAAGSLWLPGLAAGADLTAFSISFPAAANGASIDGRIILLLSRDFTREPRTHVGADQPLATPFVFGKNVQGMRPGQSVVLGDDAFGWPARRLSAVPAGDYYVQAVLNRYQRFHFADGRMLELPQDQGEGQHWESKPGNLYSKPVRLHVDPAHPARNALTLDQKIGPIARKEDTVFVRHVRIKSEKLSRFWGREVYLGAHVLLPKGFDTHPDAHYPLMVFHGHYPDDISEFRTTPPDPDLKPDYSERFHLAGYNRIQQQEAYAFYQKWISADFPRFLVIEIEHANPYYDDSYAVNSANLGPYGDAINEELIPEIEKRFRGIGAGWARFTYGGSTGGWEALATQVFYPELYNGAFAACPDPIDFRAYTLINLYKDANAYTLTGEASVVERPAFRNYLGEVFETQRDANYLELALGDMGRSGGQYDIWQAVFSPAGADGYPKPIFDKLTGVIDHEVANYWREHYDLSHIIERDWAKLAPKLRGKMRIYVGSGDNYYLTDSVYFAQERLEALKPAYEGSIAYGDRAEHCWNGDAKLPNAYSRLHYNFQYLPIILKRIEATAPKGADLKSWRY